MFVVYYFFWVEAFKLFKICFFLSGLVISRTVSLVFSFVVISLNMVFNLEVWHLVVNSFFDVLVAFSSFYIVGVGFGLVYCLRLIIRFFVSIVIFGIGYIFNFFLIPFIVVGLFFDSKYTNILNRFYGVYDWSHFREKKLAKDKIPILPEGPSQDFRGVARFEVDDFMYASQLLHKIIWKFQLWVDAFGFSQEHFWQFINPFYFFWCAVCVFVLVVVAPFFFFLVMQIVNIILIGKIIFIYLITGCIQTILCFFEFANRFFFIRQNIDFSIFWYIFDYLGFLFDSFGEVMGIFFLLVFALIRIFWICGFTVRDIYVTLQDFRHSSKRLPFFIFVQFCGRVWYDRFDEYLERIVYFFNGEEEPDSPPNSEYSHIDNAPDVMHWY